MTALLMSWWISMPLWTLIVTWSIDHAVYVRASRRRAVALLGTMGERNG